jgi:hypothetical protein
MGGGGDNGAEISGIQTPFKVPVLPLVYSTIRSISIRDEEHPLSPITPVISGSITDMKKMKWLTTVGNHPNGRIACYTFITDVLMQRCFGK